MFIVVETFPIENSSVCTKEDGTVEIFDTKEAADEYAKDCQCGVVVEVN